MFAAIKNLGFGAGKILLLVLVTVCIVLVTLGFLRIGLIYWVHSTVEDWVAVRLGFDYYVSNLAATTFTAVLSLLLPMLAWYIFLGKKQAWGIGTIVGTQLLMCAAIYTLGNGVCFDRRTGKPLCYYTDTPQGRVWSYTPGFEPKTGKPFRLYTREIKEAEDRQKTASAPTPQPSTQLPPQSNTSTRTFQIASNANSPPTGFGRYFLSSRLVSNRL